MSTSNNKFLSLQCLSNLFLNVSVVGASTAFSGKLFHKFAIRKLKTFRLVLVLHNFVLTANLKKKKMNCLLTADLCPRVSKFKE